MHNLIEQYFEGKLSSEEKQYLFKQIEADPDWKKEFITIQNLRGLTAWTSIPFNNTKQLEKPAIRNTHTVSAYIKHAIGYAAAILITFAVSRFIQEQYPTNNKEEISLPKKITYQEVSTPAGQRVFVRLPDSTTIWLNARTTLRYPTSFVENERRVELEGEAFFDVKENTAAPFIISTEKFNVKVTGTSFNVYAYKGRNEFSTSLTEGSVSIFDKTNSSQLLQLNPNERAELVSGVLTKSDFLNMDFLLWKDGIYAFDDMPFADIIKKLELYYDVSIVINKNNIKDFKFNGKFRQRDGVERVLQTLQKIQPFTFTKDDETNIITIK